jgi:hypothetical protein
MAKVTKKEKIGTEVKASSAKAAPAPARTTTPVRNTPVPKSAPATNGARREITHEAIARRAYEISISGSGGSEFDNWIRAERELRGQA